MTPTRRMLPTILALGAGFVALLALLIGLERIVIAEREEASAAIDRQKDAVEQYAERVLAERLLRILEEARGRIDAALGDVLAPDEGLAVWDARRQVLPRIAAAQDGGGAAPDRSRERYLAIVSADPASLRAGAGGEDPDDPIGERRRLIAALFDSLGRRDVRAIERAFRSFLDHRARFVIDAGVDVPWTVAVLERFRKESRPDPRLLRAILLDGIQDLRGGRMEGLARVLLMRRERFSDADLAFLAERILALAGSEGVDLGAFRARASAPKPVALSHPIGAIERPSLAFGGAWVVERRGAERVQGAAVDLSREIEAVMAEMRERRLLDTEGIIAKLPTGHDGDGAEPATPIDALRLAAFSPRWDEARAALERRFWFKTGLIALSLVLASAIAVMAVFLQRGRHRFIELKEGLVATVSHELRTPLASIRLLAETLEKKAPEWPSARDYPSRIVREIDHLAFLIDNLLSFNRLDKDRWKLRLDRVRLEEVVSTLREELPSFTTTAVDLTTRGLEELAIRADPELVELLLRNLARNSCRHNDRSPVRITIEAKRAGETVILVSDNGIGIAAAEREKVFLDFYRASPKAGSGLGLAICKKIMDAHGGRIRVAESSPEGTTFEVVFPRMEKVDES